MKEDQEFVKKITVWTHITGEKMKIKEYIYI